MMKLISLLLRFGPQFLAIAPELVKLLELIKNANDEAEVKRQVTEGLSKMSEAINEGDPEKFNAAFNSRGSRVPDASETKPDQD